MKIAENDEQCEKIPRKTYLKNVFVLGLLQAKIFKPFAYLSICRRSNLIIDISFGDILMMPLILKV